MFFGGLYACTTEKDGYGMKRNALCQKINCERIPEAVRMAFG